MKYACSILIFVVSSYSCLYAILVVPLFLLIPHPCSSTNLKEGPKTLTCDQGTSKFLQEEEFAW